VSWSAVGAGAGNCTSRCGIRVAAFRVNEQEHVFQEFYQLGNPERDRTKGVGLGLAIVRRLTQLLGHSLIVRSELDMAACSRSARRMRTLPPSR
jgi:light-regulated signal transduction histidine kinase (bacteriophytochrome)